MNILVRDFTRLPQGVLRALVRRLNRCQEEIRFSLDRGAPLDDTVNPVSWTSAIERVHQGAGTNDFVIGVVDEPLELNWFSFTDSDSRCSVITTHGWGMISRLPVESFVGFEIVQNTQEFLVGWEDYAFAHEELRGCINDLCAYKPDISFKIRTGDVCPDCLGAWRHALTKGQIDAFHALLDVTRGIALGREKAVSALLEDRCAFPVAVTWRLLRQETNAARRFMRLLDLFDISVRYAVICLVAESMRSLQLDNDDTALWQQFRRYVRRRPSLRTWVDALPQAADYLIEHSDDTYLAASCLERINAAARDLDLIALVRLRNDTRGHAYTLPRREYEQLFSDNYGAVASLIDALECILTLDLVAVIQSRYRGDTRDFVFSTRLLKGSNPVFETVNHCADSPQENDAIAVVVDENRVIPLTPFVLWSECPACHHERVLVADDEGQYLDPQVGHRVELE